MGRWKRWGTPYGGGQKFEKNSQLPLKWAKKGFRGTREYFKYFLAADSENHISFG